MSGTFRNATEAAEALIGTRKADQARIAALEEALRAADADVTWLTDLLNEWHENSPHSANCVLCPTISAQIQALGHRNAARALIDSAFTASVDHSEAKE